VTLDHHYHHTDPHDPSKMHDTEADLLKLKIPDLKALCKEVRTCR